MTLKSFLKLVEIQTKVASVIPFALGTLYAVYRFEGFDLWHFVLMLVSLLSIDMATTAINNYQDYKHAKIQHGFGYEHHNAIVRDQLSVGAVKTTIGLLLAIAILFGFLLFLNTDIVVLAFGGLSFLFAVAYSFGPIPISRTPFGEIFSGGFMGFIIPFLAVYIQIPSETLMGLSLQGFFMTFTFDIKEIIFLGLVTTPAAAGIANIMLANNICDMAEDLENKRYTFPIFVGKERAIKTYGLIYSAGFAAIIAALILQVLPLISAAALLTAIPVKKNFDLFAKTQLKGETFVTAVKNFVLVNVALALTIGLGIIFS